MRVVLIYSGITSIGFDSIGIGAEGSWINHGLCLLSACAKQAGHDVRLIDLRRLKGWEDFCSKIKEYQPQVVGATMMSVDFEPAVKCLRLVKEADRGIKTVVGGPHPSIMPEELLGLPEIDYIITGEGEISFVRLLDDIKNGRHPSEKIIAGEPADLDHLPCGDRDLFGIGEQPWWLTDKTPFVTIIAGRGCIYNCSFCQPAERKIFGKKVRRRSVDNVLAELRLLRDRYHFQSFMFHDDCLIENQAWVREFCVKYAEQGFNQEFICQGRADIICKHPDLIKDMKNAGLVGIIIGFESGNQRILNFLRKGVTVEQNYRAAAICKELDVRIQANYMLGIPTETREEVLDTLRMIETIQPKLYSQSVYTPAPGSDLFEYCKQHDLLLVNSHNDYRRDAHMMNKIKGVDYAFLAKATARMKRRSQPWYRVMISSAIVYLVRKNRFTFAVMKQLLRNDLFRRLAHTIMHNFG